MLVYILFDEGEDKDVETAHSSILRAGGKDQLLADFGAMREAITPEGEPKYLERPTLETLAKFICAQTTGAHKDLALFELAHLVFAVAALKGQGERTTFFLSPERPSRGRLRAFFTDCKTDPTVGIGVDGVQLRYDGQVFLIRFGRMPFLIVLYEFLCSMEGFAHYAVITDIFDQAIADGLSLKSLKACANGLSSLMRKYRIANLSTAQADGKFVQVYKFLQDQSGGAQIILTDQSVFDFWCLHNTGKDYRGYRTVFDLFCDFAHAFEAARVHENAHHAARLGLSVEDGEVDLASEDVDASVVDDWVSPFDIFDQDEFAPVRFFKKSSERGPIESLMAYGPDALRLPIAFVRHEIFGQVQAGITNDLQVGRGAASVQTRVNCEDVPSYPQRLAECLRIRDHIKALQGASLHVLLMDTECAEGEMEARDQAQKAFGKMNRKGFDGDAIDQKMIFEQAADALVKMEAQLDHYIKKLENQNLPPLFEADKAAFQQQFKHLYAEVLT